MQTFELIRIAILSSVAFILAMAFTPLLTHFLYKYKMGKHIRDESADTPIFTGLHKAKEGTPTMGGILIWAVTLFLALTLGILAAVTDIVWLDKLNFLSRAETWLPLGALFAASLVGLVDDYLNVCKIGPKGGGLSMRIKLLIYTAIALFGAWWFYFKLEWTQLHVPFLGNVEIGWLYIPFFIFVIVATLFSVNEIDGLDGLAGGTVGVALGAYGVIAFVQGKYDLATLCGVILGTLLAFLWFNINPARFFMGDTGAMGLGITLGIIAMLTNQVLLLPIIGFLFVLESVSVIIQLTSKKLRHGKKVFLSAPIHHHLQAKGWSETKVVMRFWVLSMVFAVIGLLMFFIDSWGL
jgi:phospho-N-acetylmuramoyl-pentapeptide-transferase